MWANYHTHSVYCDGKNSLRDIAEQAKESVVLGLSSHAPLPFKKPWAMEAEKLPEYLNEIATLKRDRVQEVYAGLEVDFIPEKIGPGLFARQLDYTIGSIHFVEAFENGEGWEIDGTHESFLHGLREIFKNNIKDAVVRYFELTRQMLRNDPPTIVGHLDKIKMQNTGHPLFSEEETWYRNQIDQTLDALAASEAILEVNTRGLYQKKTTDPYPGWATLVGAFERGIPITLSSDAHHQDDLTNQFEATVKKLSGIGFKKLRILVNGFWQDVAFDERGLQFPTITHHSVA